MYLAAPKYILMRINKLILICLTAFLVFSCNKNDDDTPEPIPPKDRGEQAIEDDQALMDYFSTHYYNYEEFENPSEDFDYVVRIDTIAGENAEKTPIIESEALITKTVNYQGVDQQLYILMAREGAGDKPTFADSTFVSYKGELLKGDVFDSQKAPVWFNLTSYLVGSTAANANYIAAPVKGFTEGLEEFKPASGYSVNEDNTINWFNDYGIGTIFIPSGLAYFSSPPSGIPMYSPIMFNINMYKVNEADHDKDGIPSYMEDLDGDGDLFNDDSDGDGLPNHSDPDDDGDGKLTRDEISINEDGSINFLDANNDGVPNYLDPDVFE